MDSTFGSCDVLIGGTGIAAAAAAIRLRSLGFRPLLVATNSRGVPGAEAIPETALPLFAELEIQHLLPNADSIVVKGFDNHWNAEKPVLHEGSWIHIDRAALAKALIQEALRRGSHICICRSLPSLSRDSVSISTMIEGKCLRFYAAIDATGRSAVWSRPIRRVGKQVADMFSIHTESPFRSRLVRFPGGWAYRIDLPKSATVAMVTGEGIRRSEANAKARQALDLKSSPEFVGRRPAFTQWSENPVEFRRLAVGDAALAYDPIAGQGICFALSSAVAGGTVIKTWRDSPDASASAERFYRDFVAQRRQRHLESLRRLYAGDLQEENQAEPLPEKIVFAAQTARTALQINSSIVEDEAIVLPDGAAIRWVGNFDLLRIRDLTSRPVSSSHVINSISSQNLKQSEAVVLLQWCIQHKLVCASIRD